MYAPVSQNSLRRVAFGLGFSLIAAAGLSVAPAMADDLFEPVPGVDNQRGASRSASPQSQRMQSPPPGDVSDNLFGGAPDTRARQTGKSGWQAEVKPVSADTDRKPAGQAGAGKMDTTVFDRRAKARLQAESSTVGLPHPLATQYPDHFTVVCEAGCEEGDAQIVYQERQDARGPVNQPGAEVEKLPVEAARNVVTCVGGCYLGEKVYGDVAGMGAYSAGFANEDNSWMSSDDAKPAVKPAATGGPKRWFNRIGG